MSDTEEHNKAASTSKQGFMPLHLSSVQVIVKPPNHLEITDSQNPAKAWRLQKQMWNS